MNLSGWLLARAGWRFVVNIEPVDKCVIVIAPHTSNWDFVLGELAIHSIGMRAGFLMKSTWFFFPLGYVMRALGGIAVNRHESGHVTQAVVEAFERNQRLAIGITPEGTRSANPNWHKGALYIAHEAKVPLVLAYFDYAEHVVCIDRVMALSDSVDDDMVAIKRYYQGRTARYPEKFVTGLESEGDSTIERQQL